jgi:hypothetical protein
MEHIMYTEHEPQPIDVWLRFFTGDEVCPIFGTTADDDEAEAFANTYAEEDGNGYRVEWYLNSVGLVKSVSFSSLTAAYSWLTAEGFEDYSS